MKTLIAGLVSAVLGVCVWLYAGTFPDLPEGHPGPQLFPRLIAGGLTLAGIALAVHGLRGLRTRQDGFTRLVPAGAARLGLGLLVVCLYPGVQQLAGTIVALSLVSIAVAWALEVRWRVAVPTAVIGAVLMYLAFNELLGVPL